MDLESRHKYIQGSLLATQNRGPPQFFIVRNIDSMKQ